jgi:hypothetical protein
VRRRSGRTTGGDRRRIGIGGNVETLPVRILQIRTTLYDLVRRQRSDIDHGLMAQRTKGPDLRSLFA